MNRRGFLKLFGTGVAAVAVVHSLPSALIPEVAPVAAPTVSVPPVTFEHLGMRGLPYIVNNMGDYFGFDRSGSVPYVPHYLNPGDPLLATPEGWRALIPEDYRRTTKAA